MESAGPQGGDGPVVAAVLATIGQLSQVAGPALIEHRKSIAEFLIQACGDFADSVKRTVAISTLGKVCPSNSSSLDILVRGST